MTTSPDEKPLIQVAQLNNETQSVQAGHEANEIYNGWIYALLAFGWWGAVFPSMLQFLKILAAGKFESEFSLSMEIISQRIIWSFVMCLGVVHFSRSWNLVGKVMKDPRSLGILLVSSMLVACNWFGFILASATGKLSDASLGYYICPLLNILMGVLFLRERLRGLQLLALVFAGAGVCWIVIMHGYVPWIAIVLALSFAFYALVRKCISVDNVVALLFESFYCIPIVAVYLAFRISAGPELLFCNSTWLITMILILSGPGTAIPLLLYGAAAKRIPMGTLGFTQFITPTLQLLVALLMAREELPKMKLVGFIFIWISVLIYIADAAMKRMSVDKKI